MALGSTFYLLSSYVCLSFYLFRLGIGIGFSDPLGLTLLVASHIDLICRVVQDRHMTPWVDQSIGPSPYAVFVLFYLELLFNGSRLKYRCLNLDCGNV